MTDVLRQKAIEDAAAADACASERTRLGSEVPGPQPSALNPEPNSSHPSLQALNLKTYAVYPELFTLTPKSKTL